MSKLKIKNELEDAEIFRCLHNLRKYDKIFNILQVNDLEALIKYSKTVQFYRNTTVIKKNDEFEFLLIVLMGQLTIKIGEEVVGKLETGNMAGYLNALDLKEDNTSPYEISAFQEGYVLVIDKRDLQQMIKKEPQLYYRFNILLARKSLNMIHKLYRNREYLNNENKVQTGVSKSKSISFIRQCLSSNSDFDYLFDKFDGRDLKLLYEYCQIQYYKENEVVIDHQNYNSSGMVMVVLEGRVKVFGDSSYVLEEGSMLGVMQFLFNTNWKDNVISKAKTSCLIVSQEMVMDMARQSSKTASKWVQFLSQYQIKKMLDKDQKLEDVIEIDLNTNVSEILESIRNRDSPIVFYQSNSTELYKHPIYVQHQLDIEQKQKEKEELAKSLMNSINTSQISTTFNETADGFLFQKAKEQEEERRKQKEKLRKEKKAMNKQRREEQMEMEDNVENKQGMQMKQRVDDIFLSEAYEKQGSLLDQFQAQNQILKYELALLKDKLQNKDVELQEQKNHNLEMKQKIHKHELNIELLQKQVQYQKQESVKRKQNFMNVLKQQIANHHTRSLMVKYGYKWLNKVIRKRSQY